MLLGDLDAYLKDRSNQTGTKDFRHFFVRLKELKELKNGPQPGSAARQLHGIDITPWKRGSMKKETILSKNSQKATYLVKVPMASPILTSSDSEVDRVVQVNREPVFHEIPAESGSWEEASRGLMLQGDFVASQLRDERNIAQAEEYYIAVKRSPDPDSLISYYRVHARELKEFVEDVARRRSGQYTALGIYATVTPPSRIRPCGTSSPTPRMSMRSCAGSPMESTRP